jgi:hypothetical protein
MALVRDILESLCNRAGLSLESAVEPGLPARNYELADRLGIGAVFGMKPNADEGRAEHVIREVRFAGEVTLDPGYTPPWPGAGVCGHEPEGREFALDPAFDVDIGDWVTYRSVYPEQPDQPDRGRRAAGDAAGSHGRVGPGRREGEVDGAGVESQGEPAGS